MGVLKSCKPRKEVLQGDLDDAVFAADFGNLIAGNAPKVYAHSKTFFQAGHGVILYDPAVLVKWAQQYGVEPEE